MGNEDLLGLADDREDMALHPSDSTEGGLLAEVERVLSQARAQNPHGDNSDEAGVWNDGFCVAWATVRAALATRTPAPSLGEDVVERVARAIGATNCKLGGPLGARVYDVDLTNAAHAALSSMRPVQEEGVGEDGLVKRLRFEAQAMRAAIEGRDTPDTFHCLNWQDKPHRVVWDACKLMERAATALAHPEASPPSLGVEGLLHDCAALIKDDRDSLFECATIGGDPSTLDEDTRPLVDERDRVLARIDQALSRVSGGV